MSLTPHPGLYPHPGLRPGVPDTLTAGSSRIGDDLVAGIPDLLWTQELEDYLRAVGAMFAQVESYAGEPDDTASLPLTGGVTRPAPLVGWAKMLDVDLADIAGLPYLAQWVGERLPTGLTDSAAREWIRRAPNQDRGTPAAIANAAFRWLTGTKSVFMRESAKIDGTLDSDWLAMLTYSSETASQQRVRDELRKIMPADIQLDYQVVTAVTWAALESGSPSWATVESGSPSWRSLETSTGGFIPAGFTLWTP